MAIIRSATNDDSPAVIHVVFNVLREYGLKPDLESTDSDLENIEQHYIQTGGAFDLLVSDDDIIIGCVGLYPLNSTQCELRKMYLHRDFRGRGYGRQLMEHALKRAKELGFCSIILETASVLKEAIGLYLRFGFKPYTANHLSSRCDQAYVLEINP